MALAESYVDGVGGGFGDVAYASDSEILQPVREQDASQEFQDEKKPCASCWSQKGMSNGLRVWDDGHLYSFLLP